MQRLHAEEKAPRSKEQTLELLRTNGEIWAGFLDGVSEDFLAEQVAMPPGGSPASRSRFDMILSVKEHEMHHRGQLMLIERIIGIVPHLTREMQAHFAAAAAAESPSVSFHNGTIEASNPPAPRNKRHCSSSLDTAKNLSWIDTNKVRRDTSRRNGALNGGLWGVSANCPAFGSHFLRSGGRNYFSKVFKSAADVEL